MCCWCWLSALRTQVDIPPHILKARRELGGDPEGRQMLFWMAPEARQPSLNAVLHSLTLALGATTCLFVPNVHHNLP